MSDIEEFWSRIEDEDSAEVLAQLAKWAQLQEPADAWYFSKKESLLVDRLAAVRAARGMSQSEAAKRMTARGFAMQQSTIAKIEKHDRPLRMGEFFALCSVLGVPDFAVLMGAKVADQSEEQARYEQMADSLRSAVESRENIRQQIGDLLVNWGHMYAQRDAEILWLGGALQRAGVEGARLVAEVVSTPQDDVNPAERDG